MTRIEDLKQKSIDLELMHMDPSDRPFDVQAFYKVFAMSFSRLFCTLLHFLICVFSASLYSLLAL